jgi:hypothetical protein
MRGCTDVIIIHLQNAVAGNSHHYFLEQTIIGIRPAQPIYKSDILLHRV